MRSGQMSMTTYTLKATSEPSQYGMRPSVVTRNTYPAPMICTLM